MKKIDKEQYVTYRTLTKLTEKELKQFYIVDDEDKDISDEGKDIPEDNHRERKGKKASAFKFAIFGCILMGISAAVHNHQEKVMQQMQQKQQAATEKITAISQQGKEPKYDSIVEHIEGLDAELADIILRIDELNLSRVEEPVDPQQLDPWMEYVQWNIDKSIGEGYVERSISWAMIKVDLQNYINRQKGLRELVDVSRIVIAEEKDEQVVERAKNYILAHFPYTSALVAFEQGNDVEGISYLEEAADGEHGLAMVRLGQCYQQGTSVAMDLPRACTYYVQAVETNQENVWIILEEWGIIPETDILKACPLTVRGKELFEKGIQYHMGHGVEKDERLAFKYFKAAATRGYHLAYCYVGCCYMNNIGVGERDYAKGATYFKYGATFGDVSSQQWLGYCYLYGYGVEKNYKIAMECLEKAIAEGDIQALHWMGVCYEEGLGVEMDKNLGNEYHDDALGMTPENIKYEEAIYEGPVYEGPLHGDLLFWQNKMWT